MQQVKIAANAKINLALAIKYRRPDGFHELESIFQEIDFFDDLVVKKNRGILFTSNLGSLEADPTNLCVAAAELMVRTFGISGLAIDLHKRIPVGAGLGGGSSDAAAVLKAANQLFGLNKRTEELIPLAEQLGSDVPFFLTGKKAHVTGRGEIIEPIPGGDPYHLLLILPDIQISTVWAYKNLNLDLTKKVREHKFRGFEYCKIVVTDFRGNYFNDFENSVFKAYPVLSEIKKKLYEAGADYAAMSGSGSTMFGVFENASLALKAREILKSAYVVKLTQPVTG